MGQLVKLAVAHWSNNKKHIGEKKSRSGKAEQESN